MKQPLAAGTLMSPAETIEWQSIAIAAYARNSVDPPTRLRAENHCPTKGAPLSFRGIVQLTMEMETYSGWRIKGMLSIHKEVAQCQDSEDCVKSSCDDMVVISLDPTRNCI